MSWLLFNIINIFIFRNFFNCFIINFRRYKHHSIQNEKIIIQLCSFPFSFKLYTWNVIFKIDVNQYLSSKLRHLIYAIQCQKRVLLFQNILWRLVINLFWLDHNFRRKNIYNKRLIKEMINIHILRTYNVLYVLHFNFYLKFFERMFFLFFSFHCRFNNLLCFKLGSKLFTFISNKN